MLRPFLRPLSGTSALLLAIALGSPGAARADNFDFSYTFSQDGLSVTGSFVGTPNGNLITQISDVSMTYDGNVPTSAAFTVYAVGSSLNASSPAVISFDGLQNNFAFATGTMNGGTFIPNFQSFFISDTASAPGGTIPGADFARNDDIAPGNSDSAYDSQPNSSWMVWDPPGTPVPDGGNTLVLLLLSFGVLTLALARRRLVARGD